MAKLLERLNRTVEAGPRLGFSMASAANAPALFILAALESGDKAAAQAAAHAGAGGLLVRQVTKAKTSLRDSLGLAESIPVGGQASEKAQTAGWDFALVEATTALEALSGDQLDLVLLLPQDASDAFYRLLESLPVDAFVVDSPVQNPTVATLLPFYRAAASTQKPVLAKAPLDASPALLRALRDSGVAGLLVDVTAENAKQLGDLKSAVAALPAKKKKASRVRPSIGMGLSGLGGNRPEAPAEPDEDDDE